MAVADVAISKTNVQNPVLAGGTINYNIVVTNNGPDSAGGIVVTDTVPTSISLPEYSIDGGGTWLAWPGSLNMGTIASANQQTIQLRGNLLPSVAGTISNTAHVTTTETDPDPTNNDSTVITQVNASADMSIVKTDLQDPIVAGTTINYNLVVSNAGPSAAQSVVVTDTVPASIQTPKYSVDGGNTWLAWGGSLNIGSVTVSTSQTIQIRGIVQPSATGTITNTATVNSSTTDPDSNNNTSTANTTVNALADLTLTKTVIPTPVAPGATITYSLALNNNGPSDAQNVIVYDEVPTIVNAQEYSLDSGNTWLPWGGNIGLGTFAAQASTIVKIRGVVDQSATTTIINLATVVSTTADPYPITNTSATTTPVSILADLSIVKTATPNPVVAGTSINYTLVISNTGPNQALNVVVADTIPASISIPEYSLDGGTNWLAWNGSLNVGTLAVAAIQTISMRGMVRSSTTTTIVNTATISSTTTDPDPTDNTATALTTVNTSADLAIVKTAMQNTVVAGGTISYNLVVTNNGPSDALGVMVNDTLPTGITMPQYSLDGGNTWAAWTGSLNLGTLAATISNTIMIKGNVTSSATATLANTAIVTSMTPDPNLANNTSTVNTGVNSLADVFITKTGLPDPVLAGSTISYNLVVGNNGPSDALNTMVTDTVPSNISMPQYSRDGGNTWAAWTGSLNLGTLAATSISTIQIKGRVTASVSGTITNTATINSSTNDPNPNNNTSTLTNQIEVVADLFIMKSANPDPILVNEVINYQLLVGNNGPSNALNVMVIDTIPTGIGTPQYSMDGGNTWLAWPGSIALGTIVATNTVSILLKGIVGSTAKGIITNTATVKSTTTDLNPTNNTSTTKTRFTNPKPIRKKPCIQDILPTTAKYFKEEMICEILSIPAEKPDMERILDVMVWPEIVKTNLIETQKGKSFEGQTLTGAKLVVEVCLTEKITYIANEPTQSAHAAHYETLKSMFVILPETIDGKNTCELVRADRLSVIPYVEGTCARMLDARTIHKCVMLLIDVKI